MEAWLPVRRLGLTRGVLLSAIALVALLGTVGGTLAAQGATTAAETGRKIRLLKPAHSDLRIQWSAVVRERGGEFLVSRHAFNNQSARRIVARVAPGASESYLVSDTADAGAWVYQLRYRSALGHERVLATIELNVDELEPGRASEAPVLRLEGPAVSAEAMTAWARGPSRRVVVENDDVPVAPPARPQTPPPRGAA